MHEMDSVQFFIATFVYRTFIYSWNIFEFILKKTKMNIKVDI